MVVRFLNLGHNPWLTENKLHQNEELSLSLAIGWSKKLTLEFLS